MDHGMEATQYPIVREHPPEFPQLCWFLAERSPQPMVAVEGLTHIVRYANPAFRRLLGKEEQHLIGRCFAEAVPEGMANGCAPLLDRVFATGTPELLPEQEHRPRDVPVDTEREAPPTHWSYSVWAILGPVGVAVERPIGVMIQVTDATEVARFRKATAAINEALLVSGVRQHELAEAAEKLNAQLHTQFAERQRMEVALRLSEERFRGMIESSHDCIKELDLEGRVLSMNHSGRCMMEIDDLTSVLNTPWPDFWNGAYHDAARQAIARARAGGVGAFEGFYSTAKGKLTWWSSVVTPIVNSSGAPGRLMVVSRDITDRKRADEALRLSNEQYRNLFQSVPAAVFSCDKEGVVQDYNRRAEEYWGRAPKRGDPAERYCGSFKLYLPDGIHLPHEQSPIVDVLRDGQPRENLEVVIERPDGSRLPVLVNFFPLTGVDGEVVGAITCFSDTTQMKRFEREREALLANEQVLRSEAEAANRSKDLFLATLSHELRTPLNAIVGWMSILRMKGRTEEDLIEGLDVIDRNTRVQVQLIDDVLDIARIISGKLRLEIQSCDLTKVVKEGIDVVRAAAEAKNITLKAVLDPAADPAFCDPVRMQQVVWNILANAIKFTPPGGNVSIWLKREPNAIQILIADSGQGMSAELLPYIFDRFHQADSSTRRKFGGLGLGLSIVKQLLEMHGGTVEAHSAGEGHGSTFTLLLPFRSVRAPASIDDPPEVLPPTNTAAADVHKTKSAATSFVRLDGLVVLVVDDEIDVRRILTKVLGDAGAKVTVAGNVAEAMAALQRGGPNPHPHILVSDIGMPNEDGFDLIRKVRQGGYTAHDLPAVALTAFATQEDRRQTLLAGFQVHVSKPVDLHELTTAIARLTGRTTR